MFLKFIHPHIYIHKKTLSTKSIHIHKNLSTSTFKILSTITTLLQILRKSRVILHGFIHTLISYFVQVAVRILLKKDLVSMNPCEIEIFFLCLKLSNRYILRWQFRAKFLFYFTIVGRLELSFKLSSIFTKYSMNLYQSKIFSVCTR